MMMRMTVRTMVGNILLKKADKRSAAVDVYKMMVHLKIMMILLMTMMMIGSPVEER